MDGRQRELSNPYGMDEDCQHCPALADCRERVVHGYGDVGGEFLVIGASPTAGAERTGVPFTGDETGRWVQTILGEVGLSQSSPEATQPSLQNVFCTYLTRCRHPERAATDEEVQNCEPFLTAEVRTINPEIIVPVGTRVLRALAMEYTTRSPDELDATAMHASTIRGRGFELVPMKPPDEQSVGDRDAFVEHLVENVMARDYRQTKGRRER